MLFKCEYFSEYRKLKCNEVTCIMANGMMIMVNDMSDPDKLKVYTFKAKWSTLSRRMDNSQYDSLLDFCHCI